MDINLYNITAIRKDTGKKIETYSCVQSTDEESAIKDIKNLHHKGEKGIIFKCKFLQKLNY
jgi:hypothetical protein